MTTTDYYKILGVDKGATLKEIKKQYRDLAKKHHPDANAGSKKSEEIFKRISAAYGTLKDKKKRLEYDRRHAASGEHRRGYSPPRRKSGGGGNYDGYEEFRERYERSGSRGSASGQREEPFASSDFHEEEQVDPNTPTGGFDLQFMVDVPLATVAIGGKIKYSYEKYLNCAACKGTGGANGGACAVCKGKKQVVGPVSIDVNIPPGVADQYVLRIEREGGEGKNGGPAGDLFLKICAIPHPRFKRVRNDIYAEVKVSSDLAEKGGSLTVQMLDSVRTIQVEEGTLTGEEYRIPGEGAAINWGKKRGDFIVKFLITND
ncbi:MAG: molecular chaperone DnaJ [Nitrospinae bacterium RIFCSPLOWO2_12_FULL_47_7]|nr:MAG: molecular chaperone DnaJ [Nitrospinae bacterium RIFCSPLOWO2_12_FULL_47_7]